MAPRLGAAARLTLALLMFVAAAAQQAEPVSAVIGRATKLQQQGDLEGELKVYDAALLQDPDPNLYMRRGLLLLNLHRSEEATSDFARAAEGSPPTDGTHRYFRAVALTNQVLALENLRRALHPGLDLYEESIKLCLSVLNAPDTPAELAASTRLVLGATYRQEAELYLRENNRVEALDLIQKALPLIPRCQPRSKTPAFPTAM